MSFPPLYDCEYAIWWLELGFALEEAEQDIDGCGKWKTLLVFLNHLILDLQIISLNPQSTKHPIASLLKIGIIWQLVGFGQIFDSVEDLVIVMGEMMNWVFVFAAEFVDSHKKAFEYLFAVEKILLFDVTVLAVVELN